MSEFNIEEYLDKKENPGSTNNLSEPGATEYTFFELCEKIKNLFYVDWEKGENSLASLEIQRRAIIGYEKEKQFFLDRISDLIDELSAGSTKYPSWYESLSLAIYHENWGLCGLCEWFSLEFQNSSSAKIIGSRIYFLKDGRQKLMPQTISEDRKNQLIKAFLLATPKERMDKDYYELYMLDGTRITIFCEPIAKSGQSSLVFRRYIVPNLSFEEQAKRGTIPYSSISLFKIMARLGFNVAFLGAVRTAKTTFLSTWQSYEDPTLEGVMVETDPEIPMHKLLPDAPVLQLIADGDQLTKISKNLLRSDADYFILAEARDGIALDTAVKLAAKGTKRMKITFHSRNPKHFPLEAATEIVKATGGDLRLTMQMVASGFDYLFHFIQLSDKRQKRLKGVYELSLDDDGNINIRQIIFYNQEKDSWTIKNILGESVREYGMESDAMLFREFERELGLLSESGELK